MFTTESILFYLTTEAVEQTTFSPVFDYKKVHHIPSVTEEFVKYLKGAIEMQIHVSQHIEPPAVRVICGNDPVAAVGMCGCVAVIIPTVSTCQLVGSSSTPA